MEFLKKMKKMRTGNRWMKQFEAIFEIFNRRFLERVFEEYHKKKDWIGALRLFLGYYAFARQGAPPEYSHVAKRVVGGLKREDIWDSKLPRRVWEEFNRELGEREPNVGNNPMAPKGEHYDRKIKGKVKKEETRGLSAIEFLQKYLKEEYDHDIVLFAREKLQRGKAEDVYDVHNKILEINGVGSKISSLFLRDVSIFFGIDVKENRYLLQPIDIWVRRVVDELSDNKLTDKGRAKFIVRSSERVGASPERVNCGMWYFGSQIAESNYNLKRFLNSEEEFLNEIRKHLRILQKTGELIDRWRIEPYEEL